MNIRNTRFLVHGALLGAIAFAFPIVSGAADTSSPVQCKDGTSSPHGGRATGSRWCCVGGCAGGACRFVDSTMSAARAAAAVGG